jgi:hypothetical protein
MSHFDSPVELPYGMTPEGARGQLKAAITEALAVVPSGHAHITVAGVLRALVTRIRTLEGPHK